MGIFIMVITPLTGLLFCCLSLNASGDGATTYVIALLGQEYPISSEILQYKLVMSNAESKPISVKISSIDSTIETLNFNPTESKIRTLGYEMAMNGSELSNKSLEVHSDEGMFVLQVFCETDDHVEGLLAIPLQEMNGPNQVINKTVYEYVVATFCAIGGYCQVVIAAAENNTEVFIDIPEKVEEITFCNKSSYYRSRRDTHIMMNRFDAIQLETTYDLTGTLIFSFKPIAVFVGSRNVTNGHKVAHTMEQLVPSSHWGTEFVVQALGSNGYGDILKIVSHYTYTKVSMTGFHSFIMKERYNTVTRRLDKGTRSHIKASHPIQVIQISGVTYATLGETTMLSMTVVPSVHNAWTTLTVACPRSYSTTQFQIVSEKRSCIDTSADFSYRNEFDNCSTMNSPLRVKYTKFVIGTIYGNASENIVKLSNKASNISGILKCGKTTLMPVGVRYNQDLLESLPAESPGGICKEGSNATTLPNSAYHLDLSSYKEHVLHLRVQVCGSAILQFRGPSATVVAIISTEAIQVFSCAPSCNFLNDVRKTTDSFNKEAGNNCHLDMSFFWFWYDTNSRAFCLGTGYFNKNRCIYAFSTKDFILLKNIHDSFDNVSLMGNFEEATFNWDFIHKDGCREYENGWRCTDRLMNCSKYEEGFCSRYDDLAKYFCAKYCGTCFADSYGRKFLIKLPLYKGAPYCSIEVSSLNENTHVGVTRALRRKENSVSVVSVQYYNGGRYYDCSSSELILNFTIISDDDVAVVVNLKSDPKFELTSTRIYPVDTFGTEFMLLGPDNIPKKCLFMSEYTDVMLTAYFSGNPFLSSNQFIKDSDSIFFHEDTIFSLENGNDISGSSIVFNKQSMVFCHDDKNEMKTKKFMGLIYFLPVNTWSSEYVVPAVKRETAEVQFSGSLHIVSYTDNNIVEITRGFDAIHSVYDKGDKIEQEIDVNVPYHIKANGNIAVGLKLEDKKDSDKSSFFLLPSVENLHDTILTTVTAPSHPVTEAVATGAEVATFSVNCSLHIETKNLIVGDDNKPETINKKISTGESKYEISMLQSGNTWMIVPGNIKATFLLPQKKICEMSTPTHNDGVDNDCDGLIDEDGFFEDAYGVFKEDMDLDGDFGEDYGGNKVSRVPIATKPIEPLCIEIKHGIVQCWKPCPCKCSYAEKLSREKNMTREQLVEAQQQSISHNKADMALNNEKLRSTETKTTSVRDKRKSASRIGYAGIGLFAFTFMIILIMDLSALKRDAFILFANLQDGYESLREYFGKCCRKKKEDAPIEISNLS